MPAQTRLTINHPLIDVIDTINSKGTGSGVSHSLLTVIKPESENQLFIKMEAFLSPLCEGTPSFTINSGSSGDLSKFSVFSFDKWVSVPSTGLGIPFNEYPVTADLDSVSMFDSTNKYYIRYYWYEKDDDNNEISKSDYYAVVFPTFMDSTVSRPKVYGIHKSLSLIKPQSVDNLYLNVEVSKYPDFTESQSATSEDESFLTVFQPGESSQWIVAPAGGLSSQFDNYPVVADLSQFINDASAYYIKYYWYYSGQPEVSYDIHSTVFPVIGR